MQSDSFFYKFYYQWWKNIDKPIFFLIIFFSPAGASFDSFKNFEDRGLYFNKLVKKIINDKR